MPKARNRHDSSFFITLTDKELIQFCKQPPMDCEFNELKEAADILAIRYEVVLRNLYERPDVTRNPLDR